MRPLYIAHICSHYGIPNFRYVQTHIFFLPALWPRGKALALVYHH